MRNDEELRFALWKGPSLLNEFILIAFKGGTLMRYMVASVFLLSLALQSGNSFGDPGAGWDLAWHDVFANDNNALDEGRWTIVTGKHLYTQGCANPNFDPRTEFFSSHIAVGPYLTLSATKKSSPTYLFNVPNCDTGIPQTVQFDYDSGYVAAKSKFVYGFFEISLRSDRVDYAWPYFLLLGDLDCSPPYSTGTQEVDIYEQFSYAANFQTTIHGAPPSCSTEQLAYCDFGNCTSGGSQLITCLCSGTPIDIQNHFYVYQFNWNSVGEAITLLPEGGGAAIGTLLLNTPSNHHDFANAHYSILGKNPFGTPNPNSFPITMDLKYLKVWKKDLYTGGGFESIDGPPWGTSAHAPWTTSAVSGGTPQSCTGALSGSSPGLCWMPSNGSVGERHLRSVYSGSGGAGGKICLPDEPRTPDASYFVGKHRVVVAGDIRTTNATSNVTVEYRTRTNGIWSGVTTASLNVPTNSAWEPLGPLSGLNRYNMNPQAIRFNVAPGMEQLSVCFVFRSAGSSGCGGSNGVLDLDNVAVYADPAP